MQIANVLASYSLGEADLLRRAMGKKNRRRDGQAARPLPERRRRPRPSQRPGRRNLRPDGQVRRLRLQQVALRRLRAASPIRPPISKPTTRSSSWPRCSPRKPQSPRTSSSTSASAAKWASASSRPTCKSPARTSPRTSPRGEAIRFGLAAVKNVGGNAIDSILKAREEAGGQSSKASGNSARRSTSAS